MFRKMTLTVLLVNAFVGSAVAGDVQNQSGGMPEPSARGVHKIRGAAPGGATTASPLMTYHGGKIMTTAVTQVILWGPSWSNPTFVADKITGLDSWYAGHSNSNYAMTSDEWTGSNGQVAATTTHLGHLIDTSTATGGGKTAPILAEVCRMITHPDPSGNGY